MATQTVPGGGGATQQANVPQDWASIYRSQGLQGEFGGGGTVGMTSGAAKTGGTPTADMSLPDQNAAMDSYSWATGGAASAGSGASRVGGGGALAGLQSLAGGNPGGGKSSGMGAGGLSAGGAASFDAIGAPAMASTAIDSTAPVAPTPQEAMPPDLAGGQMLSGPTMGRQGIGQRVPPSLAAMLKVRAY